MSRTDLHPFTPQFIVAVRKFVSSWLLSGTVWDTKVAVVSRMLKERRESLELKQKEVDAATALLRLREKDLKIATDNNAKMTNLLDKAKTHAKRKEKQLRAVVLRYEDVWRQYHTVAGIASFIPPDEVLVSVLDEQNPKDLEH